MRTEQDSTDQDVYDSLTQRSPVHIALRSLVRTRTDYMKLRICLSNRLGLDANGKPQKLKEERILMLDCVEMYTEQLKHAIQAEKDISKKIKKYLKEFSVYTEYLADIRGVGFATAGYIISAFNIHKATTVSKMWAYAGLNPLKTKGKIRVKKFNYKPSKGRIVAELPSDFIVETNVLIRADKATPGYVLPFNQELRTQMVGILASSLIQQKSHYYYEYYLPYKERLSQSEKIIQKSDKEGDDKDKAWKDTYPKHRDQAAKRRMVKAFLQDLYVAWRTIENLPVRVPYAEEYLGKIHEHKNVA